MNPKYEMTDETKIIDGYKLYRIKALRDFEMVKKGSLGGFIEHESNLSHNGLCWVFDNARVFDNAIVSGNARVSGNACVFGNARVSGDAQVYGNAEIYADAWVFEDAKVYDNARVFGHAQVYGNARVYNYASVYGNARVFGHAEVSGNSYVYGDYKLNDYSHAHDKVCYCYMGPETKKYEITKAEMNEIFQLWSSTSWDEMEVMIKKIIPCSATMLNDMVIILQEEWYNESAEDWVVFKKAMENFVLITEPEEKSEGLLKVKDATYYRERFKQLKPDYNDVIHRVFNEIDYQFENICIPFQTEPNIQIDLNDYKVLKLEAFREELIKVLTEKGFIVKGDDSDIINISF